MPIPQTSNAPLADFYKWKIPFENAARERLPQWIDHGEGDSSFEHRVTVEMLLYFRDENEALKKRIAVLEQLLNPE